MLRYRIEDDMDLTEFCELCEYIQNKDRDDRLRDEWHSVLPYMLMKQLKFMSFDEYKDARTGANIDMRPADEIIAEIEELHRSAKGN